MNELEEAKRLWETGQLVPDRISYALDSRDLFGPEVDAACEAEEPEVDLWEAGLLYPKWNQFVALAVLKGIGYLPGAIAPIGSIDAEQLENEREIAQMQKDHEDRMNTLLFSL